MAHIRIAPPRRLQEGHPVTVAEAAAERVVVVGSGPNGLAAAVALAREGHPVRVCEASETLGGGCRTQALTRPGFLHDVCSAVHPMALLSPFLRELPLGGHGLAWVHPEAPLAHPFDDGSAALLERSAAATGETLDREDRRAWPRLLDPLVARWEALAEEVLAPPLHVPRHPLLLARFGARGLRSAAALARSAFAGPRARALFAGIAAHTLDPLEARPSAAFGLLLAMAGHAVGWPAPRGGAGALAEALLAELRRHGGEVESRSPLRDLSELAGARAALLDLTPRQVLAVAGARLPARYRRALARYRYGPGVFKLDWALAEPIPWRAPACRRAGTVHLGGAFEEIAAATRAPCQGRVPARPFVLLAQPTLFDASRAPEGRHVAWAYAHVPHGSAEDLTERIEAQVERFAPGFRDVILARSARSAVAMEALNPNLVGGDIQGGSQTLWQVLARPALRLVPHATPLDGLFLCSASTPPGGGVHGMCGAHAARAASRFLARGAAPRLAG